MTQELTTNPEYDQIINDIGTEISICAQRLDALEQARNRLSTGEEGETIVAESLPESQQVLNLVRCDQLGEYYNARRRAMTQRQRQAVAVGRALSETDYGDALSYLARFTDIPLALSVIICQQHYGSPGGVDDFLDDEDEAGDGNEAQETQALSDSNEPGENGGDEAQVEDNDEAQDADDN